jgi:hypothetical protein
MPGVLYKALNHRPLHGSQLHAKVDKVSAIYAALVVLPDGHNLVHTVSADAVNDVLSAVKVLLYQSAFVNAAQAVDFTVDSVKCFTYILWGVA